MITNEQQYRITKKLAAGFSRTLDYFRRQPVEDREVHPLIAKAQEDSVQSELVDLDEQLREYERTCKPDKLRVVDQSMILHRKTCIAKGLRQMDLVERLGLKEQQIQPYDATGYATASPVHTDESRAGELGDLLDPYKHQSGATAPSWDLTLRAGEYPVLGRLEDRSPSSRPPTYTEADWQGVGTKPREEPPDRHMRRSLMGWETGIFTTSGALQVYVPTLKGDSSGVVEVAEPGFVKMADRSGWVVQWYSRALGRIPNFQDVKESPTHVEPPDQQRSALTS